MHLLCDARLLAMERPQNELTYHEMYVIIYINKKEVQRLPFICSKITNILPNNSFPLG